MRKRVCDDQGDDGPFDVNCYLALARWMMALSRKVIKRD